MTQLLPDPKVCKRYGVTPMTVWRWDNEDADADAVAALGWPPPVVYRRRKFRSRHPESFRHLRPCEVGVGPFVEDHEDDRAV